MKTLDEYLRLPYRLEITPDGREGGYVASYPELPGCLTCADRLEDVIRLAEDAKREWIAAVLEDGMTVPEPDSDEHYSGQFKLRLPRSLHRHLSEDAKREGVSMNQYCVYLLSRAEGLPRMSPLESTAPPDLLGTSK